MTEDTKILAQHMQGKLLQMDYDFITSMDANACCYCLTDQQVEMILGMVDYIGWRTRWFSASGTIDNQVILDLQGGLVKTLMCGCEDTSILERISPSGVFQQSSDGGATWTDAPQNDPRNGVPQSPPRLPPDTVSDTCTYADSVIQLFKQGVIDVLTEGQTAQQIIGIITGILAGVLGFAGGVLTFIGALIAILANAILAIGITTVQAAFTSDFWSMLRCLINSNINADGSFTQAQVDSIYSGMTGSPAAIFIIQNWIAAIGTTGLTNSARALMGSPTADCTSCECPTPCDTVWTFYGVHDVIFDGCDTYTMKADGTPVHVAFSSGSSSDGCYCNPNQLDTWSWWPIGSGSPVGGTNPRLTAVWNMDAGDPPAETVFTLTFSSVPFP